LQVIQGTKYVYAWWTAVVPTIAGWDSSTWVWFDSSWLIYSADKWTSIQKQTILPLARLQSVSWQSWPWSDLLTPIDERFIISENWYLQRIWNEEAIWALYSEGWEFTENGTNFQVDQGSWTFFDGERKIHTIAWWTNIIASEVYNVSWTPTPQAKAILVVPKYYDDGTDRVALASDWWAMHTLLRSPKEDDLFFLIYSSDEYTSKAIAEAQAPDFWIFQSQSVSTLIPVAKFIVSWSSTNIDLIKNIAPSIFRQDDPLIWTATVQDIYDNSTTPELLTDATRGALTVKRGSASDTDNILEWQNWSWDTTFSVDGNWLITWDWGNLTNLPPAWVTAWQWVSYFPWDTIVSWDNYNLSITPEWGAEVSVDTVANSTTSPVFMERYISDQLGWDAITAWAWTFNTYASVSSDVWVSEIKARLNQAVEMTWTVTSTGTGLTRTFTASEAWTFVSWDADTNILDATLIQTPTETFWIDTYISGTQVTATSDNAWYTNESAVVFSNFYKLFEITTGEINGGSATLYETKTIQPEFSVDPTDRILVAYFAVASTGADKTLSLYKNGSEHYSNIVTPLIYAHNDLRGLNEWEYKHLTTAQLAVVNATSNSNTWDQTSIVWITWTTAEFNAALTDWDFATWWGTATGANTWDQDAVDVDYDNTASWLTATNVKTAIDEVVSNALATIILKWSWDASVWTFPASTKAWWSYIVSVAWTVDWIEFNINDRLISILDNASTTVYAWNWIKADYTDNVLSVHWRTWAVIAVDWDYSQSLITWLKITDSPAFAWLTIWWDSQSGENTWDQTSIAWITGTKAQFDTAVTDDNIAYLWQANTFTENQIISGNVGIGVTPDAEWHTAINVLQMKDTTSLFAFVGEMNLGENTYYDNTNWRYEYLTTSEASVYVQKNGQHTFRVAPSGTADDPIVFTNAMTIDNASNVGIWTTPEDWHSTYTAIDIGWYGSMQEEWWAMTLNMNAWSDWAWKYKNTLWAMQYQQTNNWHIFKVAPSGTADTAITWNTAMTIDNDSNVDITWNLKANTEINTQTWTTYTLDLDDRSSIVEMNNASANTVTIPTNASVAFPIWTTISVIQIWAWVTTVEWDTGVTVNWVSEWSKATAAAYEWLALYKRAENEFVIVNK